MNLGAWSWRDGNIFVTRGLCQKLNDDELAAVISHELGHLYNQDHQGGTAAFAGLPSNCDVEGRADFTACRILRKSGLPVQSLIDALEQVRSDSQTSAAVRAALDVRIKLLHAQVNDH